MTIDLGYVPAQFTVHLVQDADFIQSLSTLDGSSWPAGTTVVLRIGPRDVDLSTWTEFPATVTGDTIAWNVDKAAVLALGPGSRLRAEIRYTDSGTTDLTWMQGGVVWHA